MEVTFDDVAAWDRERGNVEGLESITLRTTYVIHWKNLKRHLKSPEVAYGDLMHYVAARRQEGVTSQTIRKELQTLKRGMREARRRGHPLIAPDDWPRLKNDGKSKQRAGKRWPIETFRQWLQLLPDHVRDELLFDLLTGLRYTELKNARHSWVKAAPEGYATPAVLHVPSGAGKDKKEGRLIGLTRAAIEIVMRAAERNGGVGLIFTQGDHKRHYENARRMLGLEMNITRRDARHMFASIALENSQDATAVMKLMGHQDLKTTARYLHSETSRIASASAMVGAAFSVDEKLETVVYEDLGKKNFARLAQLDRALASGAKGQRKRTADIIPWADPEDVIFLTR